MKHILDILGSARAPAVLTRRSFLAGTAGLAGAGLAVPSWAQPARVESIHDIRGVVRVNGERINNRAEIRTGDIVTTGSDGRVTFVVGNDAFFLRERSELRIERSEMGAFAVSALRMLSGAVGMVFGKRQASQVTIATPTVTAGIRGTGCYMETRGEGTYFCTCYGAIDLTDNKDATRSELIRASHHSPKMVLNEPRDGQWIVNSGVDNTHTDEEMDILEKCVGRRAPWFTGGLNPYQTNNTP